MSTQEKVYSGPVSQWEIGRIDEDLIMQIGGYTGRIAVGYSGESEVVMPPEPGNPPYLGIFAREKPKPKEVEYPQVGEFYD